MTSTTNAQMIESWTRPELEVTLFGNADWILREACDVMWKATHLITFGLFVLRFHFSYLFCGATYFHYFLLFVNASRHQREGKCSCNVASVIGLQYYYHHQTCWATNPARVFFWEGFIRKCWLNSSRNLVEVSICRNELCPSELWLLKGYAEYRRMCLSPKQMLVKMKSVPGSFGC